LNLFEIAANEKHAKAAAKVVMKYIEKAIEDSIEHGWYNYFDYEIDKFKSSWLKENIGE